MSRFIPTDRKTPYLLPPSVDDWLGEDHLARFVVEVIDELNQTLGHPLPGDPLERTLGATFRVRVYTTAPLPMDSTTICV